MTALQPPPLECQWCGADIAQRPHKPTCRVVLETDTLEIPYFLERRTRFLCLQVKPLKPGDTYDIS